MLCVRVRVRERASVYVHVQVCLCAVCETRELERGTHPFLPGAQPLVALVLKVLDGGLVLGGQVKVETEEPNQHDRDGQQAK